MRARVAGSLNAKLLVGQLLVVLAGALTLLLVALLVGPGIFRRHVRDALGTCRRTSAGTWTWRFTPPR